jgi:hypothetical protein
MLDYIGIAGSICFAICGMPQAIQCAKDGHANGLSWSFLLLWFCGEIFTIAYIWPKQDWILLSNYILNFASLLLMLRYKIWNRKPVIVPEFHFTPRSL